MTAWAPGPSVAVSTATPEEFNEDVPKAVELAVKVTAPVGTPKAAVTVAVNVADWPETIGFGLAVSVTVGTALDTVSGRLVELD